MLKEGAAVVRFQKVTGKEHIILINVAKAEVQKMWKVIYPKHYRSIKAKSIYEVFKILSL